jgi:uncharacterized membrane protein YcaP (DUF421 family)
MAIETVLRAVFGYLFLILIVRVAGRRPGKQITPFEFVLIFYLGGLTLTGMVGSEASLTNAVCQILAIASCHYVLVYLRMRSPRVGRLLDGTPLLLLAKGQWRSRTMSKMRLQDDDVMAMARDGGLKSLEEIDLAVLERNGELSILKKQK